MLVRVDVLLSLAENSSRKLIRCDPCDGGCERDGI